MRKVACLLGVLGFLIFFPIPKVHSYEECCCFATSASLNKISKIEVCLQGMLRCGQCSAYYAGTSWGWGCKPEDDCTDQGELDCNEQITSYSAYELEEGSLDTELCDNYGPNCRCQLRLVYYQDIDIDICDEDFCEEILCECP